MTRAAGRANTARSGPSRKSGASPAIRALALPGPVPYGEALETQRRLAREKIEGLREEDLLLLLEHEPVFTLGRGARGEHLTASPELLASRGAACVEIERGGDVTYHGPGQLVGYPILDLSRWRKDLHWYVRRLEEALILALGGLGLVAFRVAGFTGVWVGERPRPGGGEGSAAGGEEGAEGAERRAPAAPLVASGAARKVASIGVHVSRWVTWHGFALNVTEEPLESFRLIVPCGIDRVSMTSLASERVEVTGAMDPRVLDAVRRGFAEAFGVPVAADLMDGAWNRDATPASGALKGADTPGSRADARANRPGCAPARAGPEAR